MEKESKTYQRQNKDRSTVNVQYVVQFTIYIEHTIILQLNRNYFCATPLTHWSVCNTENTHKHAAAHRQEVDQ